MLIQREDPFQNIADSAMRVYDAQRCLYVVERRCEDIIRRMLKDGDILISGKSIFLTNAPDTVLPFLPEVTDKVDGEGEYFVYFSDGTKGVATYKGRSHYYGYEVHISLED